MFSFLFKRFSGRHYKQFLKEAKPIIVKINQLEEEYQSWSDEKLKQNTPLFQERIRNGESLDSILPEAFATVKNAARRLCGQKITYAGMEDTWNMVHYDVQLLGGIALHRHMIAEMQTGEGKTLVSTCPLYLNALTGRNCQLVTVNEFLALRDSEWMGHLYEYLGLSVGCIKGSHAQTPTEKREMYQRNITYGTASEFGFDYLRDNGMATRKDDQVQSEHFFCIVDEVDSVLVDEARTPLIISGPSQDGDTGEAYQIWKGPIERLARKQMELCNRLASEAKDEIRREQAGEKIEVDKNELLTTEKLFLVKNGMPKNRILLQLMEEGYIRKSFDKYELEMASDFNKDKRYALKEKLYYAIDEKQRSADLTENGREFLKPGDDEAFVLPDLATLYMEIDSKEDLSTEEKEKEKLACQTRFDQSSEEIHVISQLLSAYSLYEKDVEYVVQEGKVMIVDENTGRVMPGRRWSDGLHQAVESKEGVTIEKETKTYATITLQNYFRQYEKLAGMTGTAETEANEFMDIYKLKVMIIPTNKPCIRDDRNDVIYKTRREKYNAVVEEIKEAHTRGQPCLVGTVSVEASELLSRMLRRQNIPHNVLNAKLHAREAEIVSRAGQRGAVTIATNMAGRGTDIKLGEGVSELGGLYVIGTERHTSRRIDRQLRGRCARQGDPGRSKFFLSLEDDLMRLYSNQGMAGRILENSFEPGEPLEHRWLNTAIERAQKAVEQQHYSVRKRLLQYDDVLNQQREVIYHLRNDAIQKEEPKETIFELISEEVEYRMELHGLFDKNGIADEAINGFITWATTTFPIQIKEDEVKNKENDDLHTLVMDAIKEAYRLKESVENPEALKALERYVIISSIDRNWQDHLTEMEELRQSVSLRGYGQKDPLQEYKGEAFTYFEEMINRIRGAISKSIFRSVTNAQAFESLISMVKRARESGPVEPDGDGQSNTLAAPKAAAKKKPVQLPKIERVVRDMPEIGRNDIVTIRKGNQSLEIKFKKAKPMIEREGWSLVRK